MARDPLAPYKKRRDLAQSGEPSGSVQKRTGKKPIFVIQKHDASRLHYDLRLEIDGVLKSWAVPKGPSTDPREKRLAIATDDHPMGYAQFEGVIPHGSYGAGPVLIWDKGTYTNIKKEDGALVPMSTCYADGQIEIRLQGKKLTGGYALIRMKNKKKQWLLIKMDDDAADARRNPVSTQPKSVVSGRTIKQVQKEEKPTPNPCKKYHE